MPTVEGDVAMKRRMIQVEFGVLFVDLQGQPDTDTHKQIDMTLEGRLLDDLEGLLTWLVRGAMRWYENKDLKTNQPESVAQFTKEYFDECDELQQFINERCELGADYKVASQELRDAFKYSNIGDGNITQTLFNKRMRQKGFPKKDVWIDRKTVKGYTGIRLKNEDDSGAFGNV